MKLAKKLLIFTAFSSYNLIFSHGGVLVAPMPNDQLTQSFAQALYNKKQITFEEWVNVVKAKMFKEAFELFFWIPKNIRLYKLLDLFTVITYSGNDDFKEEMATRAACQDSDTNDFTNCMEMAASRNLQECYATFRVGQGRGAVPALNDNRIHSLIIASAAGFFNFVESEFRFIRNRNEWSLTWYNKPSPYVLDINQSSKEAVLVGYYTPETNELYFPWTTGGKENINRPLHAAVDNNRKDIMLLLLQNNANPCLKDQDGETALDIAQRREFHEIAHLLELFIKFKPLITCIKQSSQDHIYTVRLFKACPALASVHIKDAKGNNPLHRAILAEDSKLIEAILDIEPLLFFEKNSAGQTPFILALADRQSSLYTLIKYAYKIAKIAAT